MGLHLYAFPQSNQARRVIWRGATKDGRRFIDYIPRQIIKKTNNTEMSIELKNGSIIQFVGTNNIDALMGINPIWIVYSEFALHAPIVRQLLSPILTENGGTEVLQSTPRGKNHAYEIFQAAQDDPSWFVRRLTVDETTKEDGTPVVTKEEIDAFRRTGMSEEMIRQEFYCDWHVGNVGAYYTAELDRVERDKRICRFDIRPESLVNTSWDIGVRDATSIIWWTMSGHMVDVIYYYEATDKGIDHFARVIEEVRLKHGFRYGHHFAPHDIRKREWGSSARSALSLAADYGIYFQITPDVSRLDGIQAARALFPQIRFHVQHTKDLIEALREYRREYDEENRVFKPTPLHTWASNGSDAFRYMCVAFSQHYVKPMEQSQFKYQASTEPALFSLDRQFPNKTNTGVALPP